MTKQSKHINHTQDLSEVLGNVKVSRFEISKFLRPENIAKIENKSTIQNTFPPIKRVIIYFFKKSLSCGKMYLFSLKK